MATSKKNIPLSFELLADYVDGLLDASAAAQVEGRLAIEEESRIIVEGIREFYKQNGHDRQALEDYLDDFAQQLKKKRLVRISFSVAAAAATVLVILAVWFLWQPQEKEPLLAQYLQTPYPLPYTITRAEARLDGLRQQAADAYTRADYLAASGSLEQLVRSGQATLNDRFLLGLAYLYQKRPKEAIPVFQEVLGAEDAFLIEPAQWYLALAYASAGKTAKAEQEMKAIAGAQGHYRQEEARAWLKE